MLTLDMSELNKSSSLTNRQLLVKVAFTLACKIAVIVCLGLLFFSSDNRVETNAQSVSQVILADTTANTCTEKSL